ncbi:hypothetical protein AWB82_01729 [Caballeronia glebae]|uniref:Uncharacterized protein n=1 Tax=Caballeronia glebae TaxID=1777143 RepID=A0A158A4T8_9BURK|nr:hypothetical protein AWB82_01729 [Caballeronia glebae]
MPALVRYASRTASRAASWVRSSSSMTASRVRLLSYTAKSTRFCEMRRKSTILCLPVAQGWIIADIATCGKMHASGSARRSRPKNSFSLGVRSGTALYFGFEATALLTIARRSATRTAINATGAIWFGMGKQCHLLERGRRSIGTGQNRAPWVKGRLLNYRGATGMASCFRLRIAGAGRGK